MTEKEAIENLKTALTKPIMPPNDDMCDGYFDPWADLFPILYGSYSKSFDDMAIRVLENINLSVRGSEEELAHEMFREILCNSGYCDYGTSPRVCFATGEFAKLLPELIKKWKQYSNNLWKHSL